MDEIVAVDVGGTHARFAIVRLEGGRVVDVGTVTTMRADEHASFQTAWEAFASQADRPLPRAASIAVACPVEGEILKLTNNPWIIRPALLPSELKLDRCSIVNDVAAVAHAVADMDTDCFRHACGRDVPLPLSGSISVLGVGTGLGVAQLIRFSNNHHVVDGEGGHIGFAASDGIEDQIVVRLRSLFLRVSAERLVSGPGLANIHGALAAIEGRRVQVGDERALWTSALEGGDSLASAALDRFCLALGAVAGDIALAQGATAVVIAGGLGLRIADILPQSGFSQRFVAKGRFQEKMRGVPVKTLTHPQPGLHGAAVAFAKQHDAS